MWQGVIYETNNLTRTTLFLWTCNHLWRIIQLAKGGNVFRFSALCSLTLWVDWYSKHPSRDVWPIKITERWGDREEGLVKQSPKQNTWPIRWFLHDGRRRGSWSGNYKRPISLKQLQDWARVGVRRIQTHNNPCACPTAKPVPSSIVPSGSVCSMNRSKLPWFSSLLDTPVFLFSKLTQMKGTEIPPNVMHSALH